MKLATKKIKSVSMFSDDFLNKSKIVKSPLNYTGGKYQILKQILPLFPDNIDNFIDLFAGGCNVGINVKAKKLYFNDNLTFLIEMFKVFRQQSLEATLKHIEARIKEFKLSQTNEKGYKQLRDLYNKDKNSLDLFVLTAYSFNHQIRFNNDHKFNNPFGKNRSSFNLKMRNNLEDFINKLQSADVIFSSSCFEDFDYSFLGKNDFVYCDPPYLITTGTYNDGKRGFKGWSKTEEEALLNRLNYLDQRSVKFALSNVINHKGKTNNLLKDWLTNNPNYKVHNIDRHYSNSNYHTLVRDKNASTEVLITNY